MIFCISVGLQQIQCTNFFVILLYVSQFSLYLRQSDVQKKDDLLQIFLFFHQKVERYCL